MTADAFKADASVGKGDVEGGIPDGWMGLDIGPKSIEEFVKVIGESNQVRLGDISRIGEVIFGDNLLSI